MSDDTLRAQSAVDRLKYAAFDFVMEGASYRPRLKPKLGPRWIPVSVTGEEASRTTAPTPLREISPAASSTGRRRAVAA